MEQKITTLKAQVKNSNRVSVFLDGEYAFGVARIVAAWLHVGQVLTDEKITQLQQQDAQEVAYQRALPWLGTRPRSEAEIAKKLAENGFDQPVIEMAISRLREAGLVQDEEFARIWIENRSTFRPRSHRLLALELRQKGVAEDVIDQALSNSLQDETLAYEAALKYARRLESAQWDVFREKLSAFLMRRGFSYGTTSEVVHQVWQELRNGDSAQPTLDNED